MSSAGEKFGKGMSRFVNFRSRKHHEAAKEEKFEDLVYPVSLSS